MKSPLPIIVLILFLSAQFVGQTQTLGQAESFVLFTTNGAVTNTGSSFLTGNVGSNVGGATGFGNVNGVMHQQNAVTAQAATDLLLAYDYLDAAIPTYFPGLLLGNGQVLTPGVYFIAGNAVLNLNLILDAQGNSNAQFIIQIDGTLSSNTNAKVFLQNGALACNVFWKVEGLVSLAAGSSMKGNVLANNAAINTSIGDSIEGRLLSINGAIGVNGVLASTPQGCNLPVPSGPQHPTMADAACFVLFSGIGEVTNVGTSTLTGDVGTNDGLTTGFDPLQVAGTIHPIPNGNTAACAVDFNAVYAELTLLPYDIELLYPAQFGNNLVLTPHVYLLNAAVALTDSLFLNAFGNPDAVFVFQVYGAFSSSTFAQVILQNGAQAKNVYWLINGAVTINDFSTFQGTIISQGAINLMTGVDLTGRALTGVGAINTAAISANLPESCTLLISGQPENAIACEGDSIVFSVAVNGSGLSYQWMLDTVNVLNGGAISGATSAQLSIYPVSLIHAAGSYTVVITTANSLSITSDSAALTVFQAPTIEIQPADLVTCNGSSGNFSISASGDSLSYQWKKGTSNLVNGTTFSGVETATLSINNPVSSDEGDDYYVVVSGFCSPNIASDSVRLSLTNLPQIILAPIDASHCLGESASFSVEAIGDSLNYQWRKGLFDLTDGGTIFGSSTATLTVSSIGIADGGNDYYVVVTDACLSAAISDSVDLDIQDCTVDLGIVKTAESLTPWIGSTLEFSVTVTNSGENVATNCMAIDVLNSGYTYLSYTATMGTYNPVSGAWLIGTLLPGEHASLHIFVTVLTAGNYLNEASISAVEVDNNPANDVASVLPVPIDFFIPEGFSPNNDWINDVFVIRGISHFPNNQLVIFNRWGTQLFDAAPYINNWNGVSNAAYNTSNAVLPVGTYFYVLDLGNGSELLKGSIYLNY